MLTNREFFDAKAAQWDAENPSGAVHEAVARLAGVCEGASVLDVACGTGVMIPAYLHAGASRIVGVDESLRMVAQAHAKFGAEPRVSFEAANLYSYAAPKPFDCAVVFNAYPHFLDHEALAACIAKLVAAGGRFLVAHGRGREAINRHHAEHAMQIPVNDLKPVREEAAAFEGFFDIDTMVDQPGFYCFGGTRR